MPIQSDRINGTITHLTCSLLHLHIPLHLNQLLLLGVGQRPRNTQQKRTTANNPQRFSAPKQAHAKVCVGCAEETRQRLSCGGRDDVFQGGDALEQGFVGRVDVGVVADFGVY